MIKLDSAPHNIDYDQLIILIADDLDSAVHHIDYDHPDDQDVWDHFQSDVQPEWTWTG